MLSFAVLPLFAAFASAQVIAPSSVPLATRDSWCVSQKTSCPLLCLQESNSASTRSNTCDPKTLDWSCVCVNGLTPNASEFSQTIPFYQCTEFNTQCVNNCGQNNNACASKCREDHPCGAQEPTRVNSSSISTATATKSGKSSGSGAAETTGFDSFGGSSGNGAAETSSSGSGGSSSSAAITAVNLGQTYGFAVVITSFFAGFMLML